MLSLWHWVVPRGYHMAYDGQSGSRGLLCSWTAASYSACDEGPGGGVGDGRFVGVTLPGDGVTWPAELSLGWWPLCVKFKVCTCACVWWTAELKQIGLCRDLQRLLKTIKCFLPWEVWVMISRWWYGLALNFNRQWGARSGRRRATRHCQMRQAVATRTTSSTVCQRRHHLVTAPSHRS